MFLPTTATSKKVSWNDRNNERQPEITIWPPKQEILISCRWNFDAIYRSSRDIIFPVWAAILLFPVVSHCRNQLNSSWSTDCQVEYVFSIVFNFDVKISNLPKMSHSTILLSHYVTHFNILNYWVTFSYQWGFSWKSEITEVSSFSWPVADCSYVKLKFIWSCGGHHCWFDVICADVVLSHAFERARSQASLSILSNELLVHLGLIKVEFIAWWFSSISLLLIFCFF